MTGAVEGATGGTGGVWAAVAGRRARRRREIAGLLARRGAITVPILALVTAGVFALSALSPFDPLAGYLGDRYERATVIERESLTEALGLGQSWWAAWTAWLGDLLAGDLGHSRVFSQPVTAVVAERLPWTLLLSVSALAVATVTGLGLGLAAGLRPGTRFDRAVGGLAATVQAAPPYVLSLGAIAVFALGLGWLPAGGATTPGRPVSATSLLAHLALPVLVLAVSQLPWLVLAVRASAREALASDAVRGAVLRGLPSRTVVIGHVLPVSLAPLVALLGTRLPELVVGAVLVEEVFGWPGLAAAIVAAAQQLDLALLAFLTTATTALVLLGSLLADVAYLLLDPRVAVDG